ncbi:Riboflavin biosynthesis protein RibBA [Durusdinium trenchii]|uniref:Riboflavin biosynthesis protein RibBA n=1 Tax=Durusdinium trenchii TaxID=1381693 RepID=A0ABP0MQT9_9DINO
MSGWKHAEKPIQPILLHAPERENEENEPFVTVLRKLRQPTLKGDAACREHRKLLGGALDRPEVQELLASCLLTTPRARELHWLFGYSSFYAEKERRRPAMPRRSSLLVLLAACALVLPKHGAAGARPSVEQNPHYVAPNESARAERDAEGNVTLYAWARMLPTPLTCEGESCVLQRSHREAPPSLWPTEVVLPLRSQMQVLSAWYGHPSDPGRRLDVSERVKALLEGHEHLGSGLGNLLRESLHRPLGLNDATSGGPDAQRRAANAKRERPEAPWTGQREDRDGKLCLPASTQFWGQDPAPFVWKKLEVKLRPPVR